MLWKIIQLFKQLTKDVGESLYKILYVSIYIQEIEYVCVSAGIYIYILAGILGITQQ